MVVPPIIIVIIIRKSVVMLYADEVGGIVCHARSNISRRLRVGTGGSVRVARLFGFARMQDIPLPRA
jgi:hypothetical protein